MSNTCSTGTNIPTLETEECEGKYTKTMCTIHPTALPFLNLPSNSSLFSIINAFILALEYKNEQISTLEERIVSLEERVTILES